MPKVYCINCKHLKYVDRMDFGGPRATPVCKATVAERETAIRKEILYTECKSINSKNDCPKYKPNWWKRLKDAWKEEGRQCT